MTDRDVARTVTQIEQSYSRPMHTHNFEDAYQSIVQMQHNDGGPNSPAFQHDLNAVNHKLHADGVIPDLQILGVDEAHHTLITRDLPDHRTVEQNPSHVNDYEAMGSGGNRHEYGVGQQYRALGMDVRRNPDGSYDVSPMQQRTREQPYRPGSGYPVNPVNDIVRALLGG